MSRDIDKYTANLLALEAATKAGGMGSILDCMGMTVSEFLKSAAVAGIDLSAKCLRPVGEPE